MDQSTKVAFNAGNVGKCQCPKCPVQTKSQCVSGKLGAISQALAKSPLLREDIPGVYCSTGTATCRDLDPTQSCICGTCAIFKEAGLAGGKPVGYYCRDGYAK
ncbi:MAG TPA: DUF2769 domain-containing protein [Syntrophorhabdales bacterium]|nr:DUF2769 domain-containing protein [Syntrophorhabdales bacterium]